jgi:ribosomal protein S18 acetylase RimI-like enzyme
MHVFPVESKLKDGTPVVIRLIRPEDKDALKSAFKKLSPHSNYCRFLTPIVNLSQSQLKYLTDVDNKNHLALCVHDLSFNGVGVARYVKIKNEPKTAEIAITILDEYQNQGLGTKLLHLLIEAAFENGIRKFIGFVLEENSVMLEILKKFGGQIQRDEKNILRVVMELSPNYFLQSV